jgi:hypothetical protein
MSSQLIRAWSFICAFVKKLSYCCVFAIVWDLRWCEPCGFSLWSCQLWFYLSLSCEIYELYGSSHVLRFGVFIVFEDIILWIPIVIDVFSDWLLSLSKLSKYQRRIRFQQYRIDFVFKKKKGKIKVIWPPIDRFGSFSSLLLATWPEIWPESSMIPLPQEKTSNSKDSRNNWSAFSCCWLNLWAGTKTTTKQNSIINLSWS